MHSATFFLSTGRCGTQWLAKALADAGGDGVRVEHEPLHNRYAPRRMLGAGDPAALDRKDSLAILGHVETIERELESRDYIETGHPCWSTIPYLARRLAGRVRVVHLVRHPVPTACSWLSHGLFVPPLLPHLSPKEFLTPLDPGVSFPEYGGMWAGLAPVEKCLFYWAEVNAFGLRIEDAGTIPWLRLRYEELFAPEVGGLTGLFRFLGLPEGDAGRIDRGRTVDEHRFLLPEWPEPERILRHPKVIAVANRLGYQAGRFEPEELRSRFSAPDNRDPPAHP
jgi:hypothetical protein